MLYCTRMSQQDIPLNTDITYFARTNFRSQEKIFGIKRKDRRQHMYVLGKSGTGKSVLLSNMIIQNIKNGEGVCVVDPHGELVEEILHSIPASRANDVVYFNPADTEFPVGFNVFDLDDPKYKHLVASGLMGIFTKIWANAWSSRMEYILNNAILALLDTPGSTLLGIPRLLVDKDYRQVIINNLKDPVIKAFWIHEYEAWRDQFRNEAIAPIQNKVGQFLSASIIRNVVGQSHSTIDIFKIMNEGKIFLVNVSKGRIGEDNSALLGGMIITKIQLSAMERVRIPENERKDFYLYVDEFQNFVTESFASILSEARKYRLNLTIAHQYIGQLETESGNQVRDAVFGNVGTMIFFRVGASDADFLEKELEPEFTPEDMVNIPNYHIYLKLMVDGISSRPFSAKTLPPVKIEVDSKDAEIIVDASRKNYARSQEQVEEDINRWSTTLPGSDRGQSASQTVAQQEGRFKAECSECKKQIFVPFEPQPGRPVYCKDCLLKIKNNELTPATGFRAPRERDERNVKYDALSDLGIEFADQGNGAKKIESNIVKHFSKEPVNKNVPYKKPEEKRPGALPSLGNVISKAVGSVVSRPPFKKDEPIKKVEEKKEEKKEPVQTISLNSLKKPAPVKNSNIATPVATKEAKEEHLSALRDIIAKAVGGGAASLTPLKEDEIKEVKENVLAKEEISKEALIKEMEKSEEIERAHLEEEKRKAAEVLRIAEERERILKKEEEDRARIEKDRLEKESRERALEAERITKKKEEEYEKALEEEKRKIEEEIKKAEEEKKKTEEKAQQNSNITNNKKREIPEDLLKKILE